MLDMISLATAVDSSMVSAAAAAATDPASTVTFLDAIQVTPRGIVISLEYIGAFSAIAFSAMGSAFGCGIAATSAVASWKKCFLTNKPAPFQLLIFAGAPFSQVIYGMVLMFFMLGRISTNAASMASANATTLGGQGVSFLLIGLLAGIAIGVCSYFQGVAAAGACDAQADTGKGFALYLMALGIIETVSIFAMVFAMVLLLYIK